MHTISASAANSAQRDFRSMNFWLKNGQSCVSSHREENGLKRTALRIAFISTVAVKGIDGLVETIVGILVAVLGTRGIYDLVIRFTAPELDLHPQSKAVHLIRHGASSLAHASSRFIVIWLLVHGIVKFALAIELLRGKGWIFPVAALILSGFVAYMTYKLVGHPSAWLLAFALFDAITVALVLNEWRSHRARAG